MFGWSSEAAKGFANQSIRRGRTCWYPSAGLEAVHSAQRSKVQGAVVRSTGAIPAQPGISPHAGFERRPDTGKLAGFIAGGIDGERAIFMRRNEGANGTVLHMPAHVASRNRRFSRSHRRGRWGQLIRQQCCRNDASKDLSTDALSHDRPPCTPLQWVVTTLLQQRSIDTMQRSCDAWAAAFARITMVVSRRFAEPGGGPTHPRIA